MNRDQQPEPEIVRISLNVLAKQCGWSSLEDMRETVLRNRAAVAGVPVSVLLRRDVRREMAIDEAFARKYR